jgi:hypothetical protein
MLQNFGNILPFIFKSLRPSHSACCVPESNSLYICTVSKPQAGLPLHVLMSLCGRSVSTLWFYFLTPEELFLYQQIGFSAIALFFFSFHIGYASFHFHEQIHSGHVCPTISSSGRLCEQANHHNTLHVLGSFGYTISIT